MSKEFSLEVNKETCDYLQRLAFEVMTRKDVITNMLQMAKDDVDSSFASLTTARTRRFTTRATSASSTSRA